MLHRERTREDEETDTSSVGCFHSAGIAGIASGRYRRANLAGLGRDKYDNYCRMLVHSHVW